MTIAYNSFVRRQTTESPFSHWEISDEELIRRTQAAFEAATPGYREGVLVISVEPEGLFSGVSRLEEGDELVGKYEARRAGETLRKTPFYKKGSGKLPAKAADVILYASHVLAEDEDNTLEPVEGNWEIISVNARPTVGPEPLQPETLMANYFHKEGSNDGGTSTNMTYEEFVEALRISYEYWKDKALLSG